MAFANDPNNELVVQGSDGSAITIQPVKGGKVLFHPNTSPGVTVNQDGSIFSSVVAYAGGTAHYAFMTFNAPQFTDGHGSFAASSVELLTPTSDGSAYPGFPAPNGLFEIGTDCEVHGILLTDSVILAGPNQTDIGRGYQAGTSSLAASAAVSAETIVLTISNFTFKNGRAYEIKMGGAAQSSVAGTLAFFVCRKIVAGAISTSYGEFYRVPCSTASVAIAAYGDIFVKNNTGADITTDFGLTLQCSANTVSHQAGSPNRQRYLMVSDVGNASDPMFANATVVS